MEHSSVSVDKSSYSIEQSSDKKKNTSFLTDEILLTDTTSSITVYSGAQTHEQKLSTADDAFRCKTSLCECKNGTSSYGDIRSASVYGSINDHELGLSMLSDLVVYDRRSYKKIEAFHACVCALKLEKKRPADKSKINSLSDDLNKFQSLSPPSNSLPLQDSLPPPDLCRSETFSFKNLTKQDLMFFTPDEVVVHNQADDIWVSYFGNVYDLTPLITKHKETPEIKPLLAFAGKDISNWFTKNRELRYCIHPITGVRVPCLPYGLIPDIGPNVPTTQWRLMYVGSTEQNYEQSKQFKPWWLSTRYLIGKLTKCTRPIRFVNMLTLDECTLNVCSEDKLSRVLERLLMFNSHASSYTFKYDSRILDMNKTLDENRIFDERETFLINFLPEDTYIPTINLYFNDNLLWDIDSSDED